MSHTHSSSCANTYLSVSTHPGRASMVSNTVFRKLVLNRISRGTKELHIVQAFHTVGGGGVRTSNGPQKGQFHTHKTMQPNTRA